MKWFNQKPADTADPPTLTPTSGTCWQPLAEELRLEPSERALLHQFIHSDEFKVVVKLMNYVCYEATKAAIAVDPANRAEVLSRQLEARTRNQFCFRFLALIRQWAGIEGVQSAEANPSEKNDARINRNAGIHITSRADRSN